ESSGQPRLGSHGHGAARQATASVALQLLQQLLRFGRGLRVQMTFSGVDGILLGLRDVPVLLLATRVINKGGRKATRKRRLWKKTQTGPQHTCQAASPAASTPGKGASKVPPLPSTRSPITARREAGQTNSDPRQPEGKEGPRTRRRIPGRRRIPARGTAAPALTPPAAPRAPRPAVH